MPQELHPLEMYIFRRLQTHLGSALLNKLLPRGCLPGRLVRRASPSTHSSGVAGSTKWKLSRLPTALSMLETAH